MKHRLIQEELEWLMEKRIAIHCLWISPKEGYDYHVTQFGSRNTIAWRKSLRAAYNAARKWSAQQITALDENLIEEE